MNIKYIDSKNQVENLLKSNGFPIDESIPWTDIKKPELKPSDFDELKELAKKHKIIVAIIVIVVLLILATIAVLVYLFCKWKKKANKEKNNSLVERAMADLANNALEKQKQDNQEAKREQEAKENNQIEEDRKKLLENKLISPKSGNYNELLLSLFIKNTITNKDELRDFSSSNLDISNNNHTLVQYIKSILQIEISSERDKLIQLTTLAHKIKYDSKETKESIETQYKVPNSKNILNVLINFLEKNELLENLSGDNNQTTSIYSQKLKKLLDILTNQKNKDNYKLILETLINILNFSEIPNLCDGNPEDDRNEYEKLFNEYLKLTKEQIAHWLIESYDFYTNKNSNKFDEGKIKDLDQKKIELSEEFNKLKKNKEEELKKQKNEHLDKDNEANTTTIVTSTPQSVSIDSNGNDKSRSNSMSSEITQAELTNNELNAIPNNLDESDNTSNTPKIIEQTTQPTTTTITREIIKVKQDDQEKINQAIEKFNTIQNRIKAQDLEDSSIQSMINTINGQLSELDSNDKQKISGIDVGSAIDILNKILDGSIDLGGFKSEQLKTKYETYRNYAVELIDELEKVIIKREKEEKIAQEIKEQKELVTKNTNIIKNASNDDYIDQGITDNIKTINENLVKIFEQASKKNDSNASVYPTLADFLKENTIEEKKPSKLNSFIGKNTVAPEKVDYIDSKNPGKDLISLLPFLNVKENEINDGDGALNQSIENLKSSLSSICATLNAKHKERESQKQEKIRNCRSEINNHINNIKAILRNVLNFLSSDPVKNFIQNNSRQEFQKLYQALYNGDEGYALLGNTFGKTDPLVTELTKQIESLNPSNLTTNLELPSLQKIISCFKKDINTGSTLKRKNENILDLLSKNNSILNNKSISLSEINNDTQTNQNNDKSDDEARKINQNNKTKDDKAREIHEKLKSIIEDKNTLTMDQVQNDASDTPSQPNVNSSLNLNEALELMKKVNDNLNEIKNLENPKQGLWKN